MNRTKATAGAVALIISLAGCGAATQSGSQTETTSKAPASSSAPVESRRDQIVRAAERLHPLLVAYADKIGQAADHLSNVEVAEALEDLYDLQGMTADLQAFYLPSGYPGADHVRRAFDLLGRAADIDVAQFEVFPLSDPDELARANELWVRGGAELAQATAETRAWSEAH